MVCQEGMDVFSVSVTHSWTHRSCLFAAFSLHFGVWLVGCREEMVHNSFPSLLSARTARNSGRLHLQPVILQKWPKLLLIVVAGLNSCPQCVYKWRDKQFVLKIMTNHLYLVYKRTVCSLNTCTRNCVCEGKTKSLHEQCPAWSCPLWDAGPGLPALVKAKKNPRFSFLPRNGDLGASPDQVRNVNM